MEEKRRQLAEQAQRRQQQMEWNMEAQRSAQAAAQRRREYAVRERSEAARAAHTANLYNGTRSRTALLCQCNWLQVWDL